MLWAQRKFSSLGPKKGVGLGLGSTEVLLGPEIMVLGLVEIFFPRPKISSVTCPGKYPICYGIGLSGSFLCEAQNKSCYGPNINFHC